MIGDIIRERRISLGFTQLNLSMKLFLQPQTIGKWERGESDPPLSSLKDIATALKTSIEFLLEEPENCYSSPPVNFEPKKFMEAIKYHRIFCGFNQVELAKILDTRSQTISKWENGVIMPDIFYFKKLCNIYKICPTELLLALKVPKDEIMPIAKIQSPKAIPSVEITKSQNVLQDENVLQSQNVLQDETVLQNTKRKIKRTLPLRKKPFVRIIASMMSVIIVFTLFMGVYSAIKNVFWNSSLDNNQENPDDPAKIMYTVKIFDGVNDSPIYVKSYEKGAKIEEPEIPYYEGYVFESWNCNFPLIVDNNMEIRANVKLAIKKKFNVTIYDGVNDEPYIIQSYEEGTYIEEPTIPNYNGEFVFICWDTSFPLLVDRNIIIRASVSAETKTMYTVKIFDGVSSEPYSINKHEEGSVLQEPKKPYNKGYKFESWNYSFPITINSNLEIRATVSKIIQQTYTVKVFEDANSQPISVIEYNEGDALDEPYLPFNADFGYSWEAHCYYDDPEEKTILTNLSISGKFACNVTSNINLILKKHKIYWFYDCSYTDEEKNAVIPFLTELRQWLISLMKFYDALELELLQAQASFDYDATLKKINDKIPVFDFSSTIEYSGYIKNNIPPYGTNQFSKLAPKPLVYDNYVKVLNEIKTSLLSPRVQGLKDIFLFAVHAFTGVEYTNTTGIYNEVNNKETLIRPLFANFYKVYDKVNALYKLSDHEINCIRNELLRYSKFHDFNDLLVREDSKKTEWSLFDINK